MMRKLDGNWTNVPKQCKDFHPRKQTRCPRKVHSTVSVSAASRLEIKSLILSNALVGNKFKIGYWLARSVVSKGLSGFPRGSKKNNQQLLLIKYSIPFCLGQACACHSIAS